ncbi:NADPH:quinone oxidoreductase family protein [Sphingomonas sp. RHCKR47]|uniref:NADPH:quinone oxidoreductase family protein n=1 Tax=Sphingomonas citricola TaxID=2862498 RepID=UPI001C669016|nr:NADPH:quinone oxidoreductase family protein [Sphingomonas citricola]MBW6523936.1 NADPH:quinone oxidoreductase family protein [Sphingomonas citricola]
MKALVVSALSPDLSGTALAEVPAPVPREGQVLIRVSAAALNYPDLLMTRGDYQLKPSLPFVPGMEVAGDVVSGDGFVPGEAVVAGTRLGGFAELVAVDASAVRRKPVRLSFAQAASVGTAYLTAYVTLVRLGRIQPSEWVLVHGASGGVGWATVDLARALGARVIATGRDQAKLDLIARALPIEATVTVPGFRERVKEITGGGADVIVDPVGGDVFDESVRCIAFGGRLLVVGFTSGRIADVSTNMPLIKGFSVIGVRAGEYGRRFPDKGRENVDAVWRLAEEGRLNPHVDREIPLERWRDAFEAMRDSRLVGKLVLMP